MSFFNTKTGRIEAVCRNSENNLVLQVVKSVWHSYCQLITWFGGKMSTHYNLCHVFSLLCMSSRASELCLIWMTIGCKWAFTVGEPDWRIFSESLDTFMINTLMIQWSIKPLGLCFFCGNCQTSVQILEVSKTVSPCFANKMFGICIPTTK